MPSLEIDLNNLGASGRSCEFALDSNWLKESMGDVDALALSDSDHGRVEVHVQRNGEDILVTGHVAAEIHLTCVRSLREFAHQVSVPLTVLFAPRGARLHGADEVELSAEDCDRDEYAGHTLRLDGVVREHIILEIPMNPTCVAAGEGLQVPEHIGPEAFAESQGSAQDETSGSGDASDVDPRLAPLKELARMMGQKKE